MADRGFWRELARRNVVRAAVVYAAAVWALAQGIAQLGPFFGAPAWVVRWFVIAGIVGFPFWVAFAWVYEITPEGIKRESEVAAGASVARATGRKLDYWIIGILAVAVVLLVTNQFVLRRDVTSRAEARSAKAIAEALAKVPTKSIAVLPFLNESGNGDQQYFSDGLSQDLITALSQFAGLKVISRDSAFQFRGSKDTSAQIGAQLGVAQLLEGSVRREGDEVRVSATLVKAADGTIVWSQHYDRPYKDLFALQDAITQAVATALQAKLMTAPDAVLQSDRPPSGNLEAYTAFLQGQAAVVLGDLCGGKSGAIADFREAIHLDPRYALAYARVAECWVGAFRGSHTLAEGQEQIAHAQAAVRTALTLDPDLAAARVAHGFVLYNLDFDWYGAESEYQRALQLAPNDPAAQGGLASVLAALGQLRTAIALQREALKRDPRSAFRWMSLGTMLVGEGQLDAAGQALHRSLELANDVPFIHWQMVVIEVLRGNAQGAMALAREVPVTGGWRSLAVAAAAQFGANRADADAALRRAIARNTNNNGNYQIAELYALRDDPGAMFKYLDLAWDQRDPGIGLLLEDPLILRYKDDPRFAAFCKKVGLPTTTDAVAMK